LLQVDAIVSAAKAFTLLRVNTYTTYVIHQGVNMNINMLNCTYIYNFQSPIFDSWLDAQTGHLHRGSYYRMNTYTPYHLGKKKQVNTDIYTCLIHHHYWPYFSG
jgi:hypothetical protein